MCLFAHFFAPILRMLFTLRFKWINGRRSSHEIFYVIYSYYLLHKIPLPFIPSLSFYLCACLISLKSLAQDFHFSIGVIYKLEVSESISSKFWVFHSFSFFFSDLLFLHLALNSHLAWHVRICLPLFLHKCLCKWRLVAAKMISSMAETKSNGNRKA